MKIRLQYFFPVIILSLFLFVPRAKAQNSGQEQTIIPITLTWSTNTYTPTEYSGKALPTLGSKIEVAAVIEDLNINPQKSIYTWSFYRNNYLQERITEKGKQTFTFNIGNNPYHIYSVEVKVQNEQETAIGQSLPLPIIPINPQIILQSSLSAFDSSNINLKKYYALPNQTIKFTAIPYFFNIQNMGDLSYGWNFGQEKAQQSINSENPNVFKLEINEIAKLLSKNIKVSTENKNNALQKASANAELILSPQ